MDFMDELRKEIEADEGKVLALYNCSASRKTCGIGHLLLKGDPLYDMPLGTPITEEECQKYFDDDIAVVISEVKDVFPSYDDQDAEIQKVLCNMMFQLGKTKLLKFRNFRQAIADKDYLKAGEEMRDSNWNKQTKNRSERLIKRVQALAG